MAKKTAPKKKAAPAKAKPAAKASKSTKAAPKPMKTAAKTPVKAVKAVAKPVKVVPAKVEKAAKPSLMTKKGKAVEAEVAEPVEAKKNGTIVSMLEADPSTSDSLTAEKISKVKPVKVDRGNVNDEKAKWAELFKKYGKEKPMNYKMTETFPSLVPLQHKVLGWGFVLTNENDRLEVLFENGIRMLISNYKS